MSAWMDVDWVPFMEQRNPAGWEAGFKGKVMSLALDMEGLRHV